MRIHFSVVALILFCAGVWAEGQAAKEGLYTCADLHLVPAPRECTVVKVIPTGCFFCCGGK